MFKKLCSSAKFIKYLWLSKQIATFKVELENLKEPLEIPIYVCSSSEVDESGGAFAMYGVVFISEAINKLPDIWKNGIIGHEIGHIYYRKYGPDLVGEIGEIKLAEENRADEFACILGYGAGLCRYFEWIRKKMTHSGQLLMDQRIQLLKLRCGLE